MQDNQNVSTSVLVAEFLVFSRILAEFCSFCKKFG